MLHAFLKSSFGGLAMVSGTILTTCCFIIGCVFPLQIAALMLVLAITIWRESTPLAIVLMVLVVVGKYLLLALGWMGSFLIQFGQSLFQIDGEKLLSQDTRPPVLLLRSFKDDVPPILPSPLDPGMTWRWRDLKHVLARGTVERTVANNLSQVGPAVAVACPGEKLSPFGAGRIRFGEQWQDKVRILIRKSRVIPVIVGISEGLSWEITQIMQMDLPNKLLLVFPQLPQSSLNKRWRFFRMCAEGMLRDKVSAWPDNLPENVLIVWFTGSWECQFIHGSSSRLKDYKLAVGDYIRSTENFPK